ncbi:hypothetical protein Vadar_003293 [Vaccinium darrowii]|uniref:Uncharacterized protein n=1 Tax=Vaccinium darrowii TaxID=229202 RepID=A0ACB7XX41_9ERIC|nr:hypothetical protein Vadar_003293 [Vaccinium darrowii]
MATPVAVSVNKERTRGEIFGKEKNSVVSQPFIKQYCFRAPYIVLLLREGLHITDDQKQRYAEVRSCSHRRGSQRFGSLGLPYWKLGMDFLQKQRFAVVKYSR